MSTIQQHLNAADQWMHWTGGARWFQLRVDGIFGNNTHWAMSAYERFVMHLSASDGAAGGNDLTSMYLWCLSYIKNSACMRHH